MPIDSDALSPADKADIRFRIPTGPQRVDLGRSRHGGSLVLSARNRPQSVVHGARMQAGPQNQNRRSGCPGVQPVMPPRSHP